MSGQAEQTPEPELWPTRRIPEHDPSEEDGDQSAEAIAIIEAGIEESIANREPYIQVRMPDGTRKSLGRFLNTLYFWEDLHMDHATRRAIIAKYVEIDREYSPLGIVPPLFEEEEAGEPASTEASLPRITLPPEPHDTKPDPYVGKDWAQRAAGERNEPDE